MIRGIESKPIAYVLDEDRMVPTKDQTIFFIKPKRGEDANQTVSRYAGASREVRGGFREFDPKKLSKADVEEFLSVVMEVRNFGFSSVYKLTFTDLKDGIVTKSNAPEILTAISQDLSPTHINEIFDAASDFSRLEKGKFQGKLS